MPPNPNSNPRVSGTSSSGEYEQVSDGEFETVSLPKAKLSASPVEASLPEDDGWAFQALAAPIGQQEITAAPAATATPQVSARPLPAPRAPARPLPAPRAPARPLPAPRAPARSLPAAQAPA